MKTLIVAEKKSAAEAFKVALERHGKFATGDRCFESDKYIVTWVQGHILSLKEPMDYDSTWKTNWTLQRLPWFPDQFEYQKNAKTEDIYNKVSVHMNRSDVGLIINACDAAREGELIFWEPYDHNKLRTPVKRFFESAVMTPENINRIIDHDLKGESFFEPRKDAAYARAFADLLLGMNLTIGFSVVGKTILHMGRVQTPTLAILVQRELEIINFVIEKYFEIEADFEKYKGMWFKDKLSNTRMAKKEDAEAIVRKIKGKTGTVIKKEVVAKDEPHPLLFNLAGLQKEANKKLGFTAERTLEVAQSLYDAHKILSYPRTDSSVIGTEHVKNLPTILSAVSVGEYKAFADDILAKGIKTTKRMVNNEGLSDHHAIIPTEVTPNLLKLSSDEKALFDIVARRFLAAFYPPAVYEKTEVVTEVEKETFKTSGSILTSLGWKVIYGGETADDEEEEDDKKKKKTGASKDIRLPIINKGETNITKDAKELAKETKPPKRYTEGDLIDAMENVGKFLTDDELRDIVKKAGLGTSATRDSVIKSLVQRGYIERKGKLVIPTQLGIKLIEICPEDLKSPQVTAEWEQKLREVEVGKYNMNQFMSEIKQSITTTVSNLPLIKLDFSFRDIREGATPIGKCPICGSDVVERDKVFSCLKNTQDHPCFVIFKTMAGKKISTPVAKQLLEKRESQVVDGFVSKAGKKFAAKLVIGEDKKITFSFDTATPVKDTNIKCAKCGGDMVEKDKFFSCVSSTKEKPCLSVFKLVGGKKITQTILKQLMEKKETVLIEGFESKAGKKFSAKLVLNADWRVEFAFENRPSSSAASPPKSTNLKCAICRSDMVDRGTFYSCSSSTKEKPCLAVFKVIAGKTLDDKIVNELMTNKRTGKLNGFKSKAGKDFSASLVLDEGKKQISFEF